MSSCDYCGEFLYSGYHDVKHAPDDLPDDIPWRTGWDVMSYHTWCFENLVKDERQEIAYKHGAGS